VIPTFVTDSISTARDKFPARKKCLLNGAFYSAVFRFTAAVQRNEFLLESQDFFHVRLLRTAALSTKTYSQGRLRGTTRTAIRDRLSIALPALIH
jgi:hypothetical protein